MSELVERFILLPLLRPLIVDGTPMRSICDLVTRTVQRRFTPQHLANIKRDKLDLKEPLANLRLLLERYASLTGSSAHLVKGADGTATGIAM